MERKKIMVLTATLLLIAGVVGVGVWYVTQRETPKQQEVSELTVTNKTTKSSEDSNTTTDKRVVVESANDDYTFDKNAKSGTAPLTNEEYQKLIDDNSTIQQKDTGQEVDKATKNEVVAKITEAISKLPKANPNVSSSPEIYQYYEVSKEQFGDKDALKELRNAIQYNEVTVGTVNVANTTEKTELAYEFVILKADTQEQLGYVTGIFDTENKTLTVSFSTILRDGQIVQNNWLAEHNQY